MQELWSLAVRLTMLLRESYIRLDNVRFYARHGVEPQETAVGAWFTVSLRVGCDLSAAMGSDNVADTISYADLYNIIKREMERPSLLLEHVAGRIAAAITAKYPAATSIDITVKKDTPPIGADCDGAVVEAHFA